MTYQDMTPIERFAAFIVNRPLYNYQVEAANAILHSIDNNLGWIITIMMSRQSGKNQLSAILEAFLLFTRPGGMIVKAAPTFAPQIIASRKRLMQMLENPFCSRRIWTSYAQIGLAQSADMQLRRRHVGPSVMFFSADPESNVVGATADLLLEIDEAQDVNPDKFDRDFRPMAATTNATTVMYGTAWSDDTLLARQRAVNLEIEATTGERRHFEYDWHAAAANNPNYRMFVEAEIARLGESHLAIQTQYLLHSISAAGCFFNDVQRLQLRGSHAWEDAPDPDIVPGMCCYLAGLDVGGEERADPDKPGQTNLKRDSTVLTIGRAQYNELMLPTIEVVHQIQWTGKTYPEQYAAILALVEKWDLRQLVIDNTGQGAGLASLLVEKLGKDRVEAFTFTRPSKSKLGYQLLALVNSGRFSIYNEDTAPGAIYRECWQQIKAAKYSLPAPEVINFYVEPSEGHDDYLTSLALCAQGLDAIIQPAVSRVVPERPWYPGESRY